MAYSYSALFLLSIGFTLSPDVEGEYSNDPDDPGGETKWGISKRAHPHLDIKNLTREDAIRIYYRDYWNLEYEKIEDDELVVRLFDLGVNTHPKTAVGLIQIAVNVCQHKRLLHVDGVFGPKTLEGINDCDPVKLKMCLTASASCYYFELTRRNPTLEKYIDGWLNRLMKPIRV